VIVRRLSAWIVAVPVMVAATEIAHNVAYRIVYPQAGVRWRMLAASGHGYMAHAPLVLGVGFALVAVGLLSVLVDAARRRPATRVAPWAFALLPPLAFSAQELLERWVAVGSVPWWMVEQPTFRVGLVLQLPFAVLAYVVARVLLEAARTAGAAVVVAPPLRLVVSTASAQRPAVTVAARLRTPALGWGVRGPPALV
jgi:hypothetical protein